MQPDAAARVRRILPLWVILLGGCEPSESAPASASKTNQPPASDLSPAKAEESQAPSEPTPSCPEEMALLPGGPFWVGSEHASYQGEENPRFLTQLAPFCLDKTEVTTGAYQRCVDQGVCTKARTGTITCNGGRPERADHPINCVDHGQAETYCAFQGGRLPSEVEWEYAARGGAEQLKYPWGDAVPDGHACWKRSQSCPVKSFPAGAFGLYDMAGNVWEWTADWFGPYPWPLQSGQHRVYRGGSWSRRFEKWLRPTLRNRFGPDHSGSHLGLRCARSLDPLVCPYGREELGPEAAGTEESATLGGSPGALRCLHGVDDAKCPGKERWNGVRCALEGAPRCPQGSEEILGRGCVPTSGPVAGTPRKGPRAAAEGAPDDEQGAVHRRRQPHFDEDCRLNMPQRPHAYRYEGGTHILRTRVGGQAGCKNRDVGVGWNSVCCP